MSNTTKDTLIRMICEEEHVAPATIASDRIMEDVLTPRWNTHTRRDWSAFLPDKVADMWEDMSEEARMVAYLLARRHSDTLACFSDD